MTNSKLYPNHIVHLVDNQGDFRVYAVIAEHQADAKVQAIAKYEAARPERVAKVTKVVTLDEYESPQVA